MIRFFCGGVRSFFLHRRKTRKIPARSTIEPFLRPLSRRHCVIRRRTSSSRACSFPSTASVARRSRGIGSPKTTRHVLGRTNHASRGNAAPEPGDSDRNHGDIARTNVAMNPRVQRPDLSVRAASPLSEKLPARNPCFNRSIARRRLDLSSPTRDSPAWCSYSSQSSLLRGFERASR